MKDTPGQRRQETRSPSSQPAETPVAPTSGRTPVALVGVIVIIAAVGVVWLLWAALGHARQPKFQVLGYEITGRAVTVRFEVVKPADARVACVLRARDASGLEVARRQVMIEPGVDSARHVVTRRLVGTAVPVSGEVTGCRVV